MTNLGLGNVLVGYDATVGYSANLTIGYSCYSYSSGSTNFWSFWISGVEQVNYLVETSSNFGLLFLTVVNFWQKKSISLSKSDC